MKTTLLALILSLGTACGAADCGACADGACSAHAAPAAGAAPAGHVVVRLDLAEAPSCASCTGAITGALEALPGVSKVEVAVGDTALRVWHDPALGTDALLAALDKAGKPARPQP